MGGSIVALWPAGISTIEDLPNDLILSIAHAQRVCNWQENLVRDEMPPHWMWHLDHEIISWFEKVEEMRNEKYSGVDSGATSADSQEMQPNEFAANMRG